jgi:multidrug efflux pump subunit AcrA (membrane-fusion protein)
MRKQLFEYRRVISIMILIGILGILSIGCSNPQQATVSAESTPINKQGSEKVLSVRVSQAQKGSLANYITLAGEVKADRSVNILPKTSEEVKKVYVEVGDRVKQGDKLVALDNSSALIQVEQAKASLQIAQANLEETLNGAKEEEILQLEAELASAKAAYQQAQKNYQRQKDLFEQRVVSSQTLEEAENDYITAKSQYQSAKYSLKLTKDGATQEEIKALKGAVTQGEASLKAAKLDLSNTLITAPIDGIVSSVDIEKGEVVFTNSEIMTISNIDTVKLITYISQSNINKIKIGEEVQVDFKVLQKSFIGEIKNISPVADSTKKSYPVEISINNQNNIIKAGMYAKVTLQTDQVKEAIIIPQNAVLTEDNGNKYVYIVENDIAIKSNVKIALSTKSEVAILEGLKIGNQVVITGVDNLTEGSKVKIVTRGDN